MDRIHHWHGVYEDKSDESVSWFEPRPESSLSFLAQLALPSDARIIDVGGGASRLVDALVEAGFTQVTVLDVAPAAMEIARARLGDSAARVHWIEGDVLEAPMPFQYRVWHDRAVFHFLTLDRDRARYLQRLQRHLEPGGSWIVATFAPDGPERCSGLPVVRYDPDDLDVVAGDSFRRTATRRVLHTTPAGKTQAFNYCVYLRV